MFNVSEFPSGLTVITEKVEKSLPAIAIWVNTGSRDEAKEINGISHALEHMVFKGTKTRNVREIAETVENVGGIMNAYTSKEVTCYHVRMLNDNIPLGLEILRDFVKFPTLPQDEWDKEKTVICQEIGDSNDTPSDVIYDHSDIISFPNHSLGRSILGTKESVMSFKIDDFKQYMSKNYTNNQFVIGCISNLSHEQVLELVSKYFEETSTPHKAHKRSSSLKTRDISTFKGGTNEHVKHHCMEWHFLQTYAAPTIHSDDYPACLALSTILGGGMSSRLFQNVREKNGLAYSTYSSFSAYDDVGTLYLYAATSKENDQKLKNIMQEEVGKIQEDINLDELNRAKNSIKVRILGGQDSVFGRLEKAAMDWIKFGRIRDVQERVQMIESVSLEGVQKLSRDIFSKDFNQITLG